MSKFCTKCCEYKVLHDFSKRKLSKDGLDLWCKPCKSRYEKGKSFTADYTGSKSCTTCKIEKPKIEFHRDHRISDGLESRCKPCNDKRARKNELNRYYGLTEQDYELIKDKQNNGCAICGSNVSDSLHRRLSVDHCHKTKKVRGLLCTKCNNGIGNFNDDILLLKNAIKYLEITND
jgi:hypothetical protein